MNGLRDLISKLQKIEEKVTLNPDGSVPPTETVTLPNGGTIVQRAKDPAAPTDPRAQYDQFKADDAKNAAIETVKKYMAKPINQIGRLENLIDPKTGFIYYGQAGMDATTGTPTKMPMRFMSQGDQKSMMDAITAAGLKVVDSGGYAMIDPASLKTLGQAPAPAEPAPVATATPVAPPADVNAKPLPAQSDPNADNSGASPAATTDFDSMSFGTAFKTARNQGLKQFTWKGKPYTTQTSNEVPKKTTPAPSSSQKVMPKLPSAVDVGIVPQPAPVVTDPSKPGFDFKKASAAVMGSDQKAAPTTGPQGQPLVKGPDGSMGYYMNPVVKKGWQAVIPAPVKEEVGFTDESLDRIVSLVHYR